MDSAISVFKFAAKLFFAVALISLFVWLWLKGSTVVKTIGNKQTQSSMEISNSAKTKYDGLMISGADVVNAVNNLKSDGVKLSVVVKVKENGKVVEKTMTDFSNFVNLPSNALYINPYAKFLGKVTQNKNGVVSGLTFTQDSYVARAIAVNDDYEPGAGGNGGVTNSELKQSIESFTTVANDLTTAVSSLQKVIADTKINGSISTGGGGVSSADIYVLKDSIATLNGTVGSIKQFCDEFDTNHGVDLSVVTSQLAQIQENLSNLSVSPGMTADDVQSAIDTSQTVIGLLNAVEDLGKALGTLSGEISGIQDTLNGKTNDDNTVTPGLVDDVADLQGQVSELKTQLDEMKEILNYLAGEHGGND